jgi:hypothetical protein
LPSSNELRRARSAQERAGRWDVLTECPWPGCRWTYVGLHEQAVRPLGTHVQLMHAGKQPPAVAAAPLVVNGETLRCGCWRRGEVLEPCEGHA